jgi:serine/threonine-protein kinase PknK
MQYHPHGSVEDRIRDEGPLGWRDALHIGVKVAGALETAHRRGMLHRDVKPGNILLTEYGEPQLTDFGIARIGDIFETSDGSIVGSPAYTAPEVLQGQKPTVASDVYSLASTVFTIGTGMRCSSVARASRWWHSSSGSPDSRCRACPNRECRPTCARSSSRR